MTHKRPSVLVTRPEGQQVALLNALKDRGLSFHHRGLIKITDIPNDDQPLGVDARNKILALDSYDGVIAISRNAATIGLQWIDQYWPQLPVGIQWCAVGPTTASPLVTYGINPLMPASRFDSEGLLACPELKAAAVNGKKWLILRGVGGRETLAETLLQRGARVDYAELYHRVEQKYDQYSWDEALSDKPILIISSGQALSMIERQVQDLVNRVEAVIIPSERVARQARETGYKTVLVAASARNEDTLACLDAYIRAS